MPTARIMLRRNGAYITWDSLANDQLFKVKEQVFSTLKYLLTPLTYEQAKFHFRIYNDGCIKGQSSLINSNLNIITPIKINDDEWTYHIVINTIAIELYKEAELHQRRYNPTHRCIQKRFMTFYKDDFPEEFNKPPLRDIREDGNFVDIQYTLNPPDMLGIMYYIHLQFNFKRKDQRYIPDYISVLRKHANKMRGSIIVYYNPEAREGRRVITIH
jgi:hypothetical protein